MKDSFLALIEAKEAPSEFYAGDVLQQTITTWLTTQLNTTSQMMPAPNFRRRHLK